MGNVRVSLVGVLDVPPLPELPPLEPVPPLPLVPVPPPLVPLPLVPVPPVPPPLVPLPPLPLLEPEPLPVLEVPPEFELDVVLPDDPADVPDEDELAPPSPHAASCNETHINKHEMVTRVFGRMLTDSLCEVGGMLVFRCYANNVSERRQKLKLKTNAFL
jgi:hypothetical protein